MDTQSDSSGALDTNQAASLFASMLDPQAEPDKVEPEAAELPEEITAEAADEAKPEAETTTEDDDPTVTVKVDGKDVEVKLSELKGSYQKDKAASQRFEQAAELRKQADAETQKAQAERQAYAQKLQGIQTALEAALQQQQQTDWDALLQSDPVEYLRQQRLAQERQALYQRTLAERNQIAAQNQAEQAKAYSAHLASQREQLLAKLPEWKDPAKAKADGDAIKGYLLSQGYSEEDADSVADARAVVLARKAMLYDQMVQKASAAAKKVATLPTKVERAGNGQNPGLDRRSSAFQNLSKSGRVEDAAAVFAGLL